MSNNYEQNRHLSYQDFQNIFSSYLTISDMLKTYNYDEILESVAILMNIRPKTLEQRPMGSYSKGITSGLYRFVLQDLLRNIEQYDWLYSKLEDDISRLTFANLIGYRIFPVSSFLEAAYDVDYPKYFDKSIISCNENEVFVDCGGYTGDTTELFIQQFNDYRHIYVYEPAQNNVQACRDNLKKYPNITIHQRGAGERSDTQMVSLDEDIQEPITFLKMDVEGFEVPALLGAKQHIRDDFPKLAICVCHSVNHMWEISRLVDSMHAGYSFFIRHYHLNQNQATVFYAVPPEQKKKQQIVKSMKARKCIVSPAFDEGWTNALLIKDCGLIPYLFHKNYNFDAYMIGGKRSDEVYSNMKYIKGMKVEFLPDGKPQTKVDWIEKNALNIDCLQLYGCYPFYYLPLVNLYKKKNPEGKVSLALDPNSGWMDRIQWTNPDVFHFMDQCDVISSSGRVLQKHLNEKWPWIIEYIPNGFYNFSSKPWGVDFEKKENIILTVGRLGTAQKRTYVLLEAFAQIAENIPDWELRLAGSMEPEFESYMTQFWKQFPHLQHRIQFLGSITDRDALYAEYQRAKIFALSSFWEGGTPNVIAEALYAGDAVAITKIDEYQDATDHGRCGMASEIDDVSGFANILLQLCQDDNLEEMCRHAYDYAQENYDMEKIVAKLYSLLFGEEG